MSELRDAPSVVGVRRPNTLLIHTAIVGMLGTSLFAPSPMRRFATSSHITRGRRAEQRAERYLKRRGLATVVRNYARATGEVDLVMLDGEDLVFVEVRYRGPGAWSSGLESVDRTKQRRIARTGELFRRHHPEHRFRTVRFDVVAATKRNLGLELEWIQNAFDATDCA